MTSGKLKQQCLWFGIWPTSGCTVVIVVDTKLTLSDPSCSLAYSSSSGESVRLPLGSICFVYFFICVCCLRYLFVWVLMPACFKFIEYCFEIHVQGMLGVDSASARPCFDGTTRGLLESNFWVVTACGRSYLAVVILRWCKLFKSLRTHALPTARQLDPSIVATCAAWISIAIG